MDVFSKGGRSSGGWTIATAMVTAERINEHHDWEEAQKALRERLQARDSNTYRCFAKASSSIRAMVGTLSERFPNRHLGTEDVHLSYTRVAKHLNAGPWEVLLVDLLRM
jgi:hypothetical protein